MALGPGTRLGPYEVIAPLGAGGMGEVYRARDTRLNRDVALKILPDTFASDPDRLARFRREASVLASLNHPNIGQIYGLEDAVSRTALVLELVEGPTLAEVIARAPKGLPLEDAIGIADQVARALEAAHNQGVIHRDLKPANIKVSNNGTVKVLDFGLAKALDAEASSAAAENSPTLTSPAMTSRGVILGTAAYMSPEQARGKVVDKRADIWAFGCVLYEMLTGAQTFGGETLTDTLAAVVKTDPDMAALPPVTTPGVRSVLRRCLQKDPARRFHDIADVRIELQEAVSERDGGATATAVASRRSLGGGGLLVAAAMLMVGLAIGAVLMRWLWPSDPTPIVRLTLTRPDSAPIGSQAPVGDIAVSRDGRRIAYVTGSQGTTSLAIRALGTLDVVTIPGVTNPIGPFMSPDGNWIGFFEAATSQLKKAPAAGGTPQLICAYTGGARGASWGDDNRIVFATTQTATGLLRVPAAGGTPETLTKLDLPKGEMGHWFPEVLPGGAGILFSLRQSGSSDGNIAVFDIAANTWRTLVPGGFGRYVKSGHVVYSGTGALHAFAFDARTLQVQSEPSIVVDHVITKGGYTASFDIADDGTLAYLAGEPVSPLRTLVWVDREKKEEAIKAPARTYVYPRISPDGRRVAFDIRDQENDIWTLDLATGSLARLTIDPGINRGVAWTPDGTRIAFSAVRDGKENVFWQAADGSGAPDRLTESSHVQVPSAFTPDGKHLIFQQPGTVPFDLSMVDVTQPAGQREVKTLLNASHSEGNGEVSPDGKWIAYESSESGQRSEIFVRPYPNVNAGRWQVSNNGGSRPVWLPKTGAELFYVQAAAPGQDRGIMSVPILPGATFSYGTPRIAVTDPPTATFQGRHYDVSADGKKFLFLKPVASATVPPQLIVVLNWVDELKKLVPATK